MEPIQGLGLAHFLAQTDAVGKTLLAILLLMSLATWYLIAVKSIHGLAARRRTERFLALFWDAPSLQAVERELEQRHPDEPFSHLAFHALAAARHHARHGANKLTETGSASDFLTRSMRRVIDEETARLESGLTVLASVGSTAPFVGLFGTVVGIMMSFQMIGETGSTNLAAVGPGIAEALIATAFGLVAAVPAVVAYNHFTNRVRLFASQMDDFAMEFLNIAERNFT